MAVFSYKCPNCDGDIQFEPKTQSFHCQYCLSDFTKGEMDDIQAALKGEPKETKETKKEPPKQEKEEHIVEYSCPSCGAEIMTDETTAATFCYYCHNPVILSGRLGGSYRPDKLIPFMIDKEKAIAQFLQWTKKKYFIPKDFFSKEQIDKITGVYFPYWLVDSDLSAHMTAKATKVRVWRSGETEYTETQHYQIMRQGNLHFEDITKNALNKENSKLVNGVHPYDSSKIIDYSESYLSGFQAEKRNIESNAYVEEVNKDINKFTETLFKNTIKGYSTVISTGLTIQGLKSHWDYTLFPAWILTYRGNDNKTYYYSMNAQTGKVSGILPLSYKKLFAAFGIISVILAIILVIGGLFI